MALFFFTTDPSPIHFPFCVVYGVSSSFPLLPRSSLFFFCRVGPSRQYTPNSLSTLGLPNAKENPPPLRYTPDTSFFPFEVPFFFLVLQAMGISPMDFLYRGRYLSMSPWPEGPRAWNKTADIPPWKALIRSTNQMISNSFTSPSRAKTPPIMKIVFLFLL